MSYVPAAMPELLVVGSDGPISDGTNPYIPTMCFDPVLKRFEGHLLRGPATGGLSTYTIPQGTALNLSTDTIGVVYHNNTGILLYLHSIATMKANGAAYSASAANIAAAIKTTHYATNTLTATNLASNGVSTFVLPYTKTHFLVVNPVQIWVMSLADCSITSQFTPATNNASYLRFVDFGDISTTNVTAPTLDGAGNLTMFVRNARNSTNTADVAVNAVFKINPTTGVTLYSNYSTGISASVRYFSSFPDGASFMSTGTSYFYFSADLATKTTVTGLGGGSNRVSGDVVSAQNVVWNTGNSSSPYYPSSHTITGSTGTSAVKTSSTASTTGDLWQLAMISMMDANTFLARSAANTSTGASIGSSVGVYNKSDGSVATGYTKQQMLDYAGAMTVSGGGFNNVTFGRPTRSHPDPTLYTVREVLQLMGSTGPTYHYYNGTTIEPVTPHVYNGTAWVEVTAHEA